jgi:hypothetical protein
VSDSDLSEIQATVNSTLRVITDERASPGALAAEIGLIPVQWLWAQTVAGLGGRLQTNRSHLRAASRMIVTSLLSNTDKSVTVPKGWFREYHIALCLLDLKDHWPVIQSTLLDPLTNPLDILLLENFHRVASPLAPY